MTNKSTSSKLELAKTRKLIVKKYKRSHNDRIKRERVIGETFTPIVEPIGQLVRQSGNQKEVETCDGKENHRPIPDEVIDDDQDIDINDDHGELEKEEVVEDCKNDSTTTTTLQKKEKKEDEEEEPYKKNQLVVRKGPKRVSKPSNRMMLQTSTAVEKRRRRQRNLSGSLKKAFIPYNPNIVYEYWDNPNELCDRLRLLVSSQSAGNTNHNQEINSILEELGEQGIIF